mgnify:FL=1|tara:strand:- start:55 stop:720 length:666 start_codon:yes stop_codon:yes gene_type:complete
MLKKWMVGLTLLSTSLCSQATLITSSVDSVDMAGIEVTAYFANSTQQTLTWSAFSATQAGVDNGVWSLTLEGNTFGDYDDFDDNDPNTGQFYGLWNLTNTSTTNLLMGLSINAGIKGFYFDVLSGSAGTPGSEAGREFVSDAGNAVVESYANEFSSPDLFGVLNIGWQVPDTGLISGQSLQFQTDTDKATPTVSVPEPASIAMFSLGLLALTRFRKKSAGK